MLPRNLLPVYEKDSFLFFKHITNNGSFENDSLIIDVSRIHEIAHYMQTEGLSKVMLNSFYFSVNDLLFLKHIPFIKSIHIVDDNHNISPLNNLHEIEEIRLGNFEGILDFNNFPELRLLNIVWKKELKNLANSVKLNWLWLDFYKEASLEEFNKLDQLSFLYLNRPSIRSLKGIEAMSSLKELTIDKASKLETLDGLSENNKNLIDLDIYNSKKLNDYNALKHAFNLEKLRLGKTGDMKDIEVLKLFKNLKSVILGIKITSGDMLYLQNIPEYGFINFPHYNLKFKKK